MKKKQLFLILVLALLALLLITANCAFAKSVTFQREYTYQASEADSKLSCRTIALEQVKRLLLEELGVYLESKTEVKDYRLTKDQITTLTAGVVQTEIIDEKWDGREYWLKAKINADPDEVAKSIRTLREDHQRNKELEEARNLATAALSEIKRLRRELELEKGTPVEDKLERYNATVNELNATGWLEKGWVFYNSKNYEEAIKAFTKAIELNPNLATAYIARGSAYYAIAYNSRSYRVKREQSEMALRDFTHAIEIKPNDATPYVFRGIAYGELGDYQKALADYKRASVIDPDNEYAYFGIGNIHAHQGQYDKAVTAFKKALEINPKFVKAYHELAVVYEEQGNSHSALVNYGKAIQIQPNDPNTYYSRGLLYLNALGNHQRAFEDFDRAIYVNPRFAIAYVGRGLSFSSLGDYENAMIDFNTAINFDPSNDLAYYSRGFLFQSLEDYHQAIRDYTKALDLNPTFALAFYNRALAYAKIDMTEQAVRDMKTADRLGIKGFSARNNIYRWTDEKGVVHLSQDPPAEIFKQFKPKLVD